MSQIIPRLHRAAGQVQGIEKMLKEKAKCKKVLIQILAARASLAALAREIIRQESKGCSKKELDDIMKELFKVN